MFDYVSVLTVYDLLADPDLGLELVGGRDGVDREIEAAAVSELTHPGPWLQGGELLLTIGLLLPRTVAGCRDYLAALDAAERSGARLAWIPRRAGDRGAIEAGCLPNLLPGGRPVADTAARIGGLTPVDAAPPAPRSAPAKKAPAKRAAHPTSES